MLTAVVSGFMHNFGKLL